MNRLTVNLIILLAFALSGCSLGASMHQQFTALNVDCKAEEVVITNETADLDGEESWTAKCEGETYYCSYFPSSDSSCYPVSE